MKQSEWSALFEMYPFFEAYKNYLQIDIMAIDEDDLRTWKGWVESRLRQLTLKVRFPEVLSHSMVSFFSFLVGFLTYFLWLAF